MAEPGPGGFRPRSMKRVLLEVPLFLGLVVGLFLVTPAPVAHACTCAMLGTEQQVEGADVVVRGTITGLHDPGGASSARLVTYEVAVAEVFKGKSTAATSLRSAADGGSCGIEVQEGPEYLLFARRVGSDLRTGLCGGTRPVSDELVTEVEAVTGPGTLVDAPTSTASPAATPTGTTLAGSKRRDGLGVALPLGVGAAGALLAAALAALWWRRRGPADQSGRPT